jgi:uncharacterized membrane protein YqgA involved in biofilm formation
MPAISVSFLKKKRLPEKNCLPAILFVPAILSKAGVKAQQALV